MAGDSSGGRGALLYWLAYGILVILVVSIAILVFRDPSVLGI
ncbi:MAG TPA: hypothetical protein VFO95_17980 [Gemmatimonadales bacterium]|nr:hypothetical protein [Gemmatimonadales bacterium]